MNGTPWKKRKQSSSGTSFRNLRIYRIIESGNYVYYFQYQTYDSVLLKRRRRGRLRRRPYFYRIDIHLRLPYPDHCARITVHPKLNVTQEERKHQIVLTKQRPRDDGSVHIYPKEIPSGIESNWTGARGWRKLLPSWPFPQRNIPSYATSVESRLPSHGVSFLIVTLGYPPCKLGVFFVADILESLLKMIGPNHTHIKKKFGFFFITQIR
jgi:hypothetical protein